MTTISYQCLPNGTKVILDPANSAPLQPGYEQHVFQGTIADLPKPPGVLRRDVAADTLIRVVVPPAPQPVPVLTARQLRLWLIDAGLTLAAVEAQIAAILDETAQAKARVEWEYATAYHHDHPLVLQFGAALGLDQVKIDAAFRAAALL